MAGHIADSSSIHWCSPLWLTDGAHKTFEKQGGIGIDPCGNEGSKSRINAKVTLTLPNDDGLVDPWHFRKDDGEPLESAFVNSPFGAYYMNKLTRDIVLPKELKAMCDALCVDPKKPTLEEKQKIKITRRNFAAEHSSHSIDDWRKKCADTWLEHQVPVINLGPANVDTIAWHKHIEASAAAILYIKGRVYFELVDFGGELDENGHRRVISTGPAPMACAAAYWGPDPDVFAQTFAEHGSVHILR